MQQEKQVYRLIKQDPKDKNFHIARFVNLKPDECPKFEQWQNPVYIAKIDQRKALDEKYAGEDEKKIEGAGVAVNYKRRDRFYFKPKKSQQPWVLKDSTSTQNYLGTPEGGISKQFVLFGIEEGGFSVMPVSNWYNFRPNIKRKTEVEALKIAANQEKIEKTMQEKMEGIAEKKKMKMIDSSSLNSDIIPMPTEMNFDEEEEVGVTLHGKKFRSNTDKGYGGEKMSDDDDGASDVENNNNNRENFESDDSDDDDDKSDEVDQGVHDLIKKQNEEEEITIIGSL